MAAWLKEASFCMQSFYESDQERVKSESNCTPLPIKEGGLNSVLELYAQTHTPRCAHSAAEADSLSSLQETGMGTTVTPPGCWAPQET